jgi:hypothetical protein
MEEGLDIIVNQTSQENHAGNEGQMDFGQAGNCNNFWQALPCLGLWNIEIL